jgi:hypothetical protein
MGESSIDNMEQYKRVKQAIADGQATIDTLVAFFRDRAVLEEGYSKSLSKLSKQMAVVDGTKRYQVLSPLLSLGTRGGHARSLGYGLAAWLTPARSLPSHFTGRYP